MAKTKDLFLNIIANPTMTLEDLVSVGITSENTMLLDRASYASNEKIQNAFKDNNGNFDEAAFNRMYDIAEQSYNILANDEANLNLMNVTAYDVDNIFVDPSKRTRVNAPTIVQLPNPDRLNVGLTRVGKTGPRTLSQDEIAQTQEVLLNPVEVSKGAKPVYGKAPNDSWFEDFWDTKVMAVWDEDGTHIDPVTGVEMQHKKGDLKLNENGTYYYESLDGRSVYGKRILNKFNTLTTDGSSWNKYDFFDSDDIKQKSVGGSLMKNLALVGSMFIPYVGWGIAAASVVHQMAGLTATFGKMLAGSDSPALNALEGWVKSTDRRNLKTEYAQQNMWCWENFIDLIGDTTAQLREQRAIFKFAPGIIKGDFKALDEKAMARHTEKAIKESMENLTTTSYRDLARLAQKQNPVKWQDQLLNLTAGARDIVTTQAQKAARDYVSNYYKLGEPIARAYMTAITVQDTFGEAIQAGATDGEATLLTLGYAAAEAALLSTDLGKWIMPELRMERQRAKTIAKKLLEVSPEVRDMSKQLSRLDGETKKTWAKRLFNVGKDIFNTEYSTAKKTVGSVLAQGVGEGIEEVSEEALADFSKSCFNLVQKLQGDEVRLNAFNHNWSWGEAANRYGMSFAGGIIGGGINAAASDYKGYRGLSDMTSQQAMQELIYMVRNGEMDNFWKDINKIQLASTELGTQRNESGIGFKPGTKDDNQDLEAKRALKKQVSIIESILNAEGGKLDDSGLLSIVIKADPKLRDLDPVKEYRMRALANSATAGRFLNEYNLTMGDIVIKHSEIQAITDKYGDISSEKYSEEDKQTLKNLNTELKRLQDKKNEMLEGGRTREYVRDALFEMTHPVKDAWDTWATEVRYAEAITGKAYKDISEKRKQELKEKYETVKSSNEYAEQIHELANMYEALASSASTSIQASAELYENLRKKQFENISKLQKFTDFRLSELKQLTFDSDSGITAIQRILNNSQEDLVRFEGSDVLIDAIKAESEAYNNRRNEILKEKQDPSLPVNEEPKLRKVEELSFDEKQELHKEYLVYDFNVKKLLADATLDTAFKTIEEAKTLGYIHPETKHLLNQMYGTLQSYLSDISNPDTGGVIEGLQADVGYDIIDQYADKSFELQAGLDSISDLPSTPIIANLKQFYLSTTFDKSVLDLAISLINQEKKHESQINTLQLDADTIGIFEQARDFLKLYRSVIVGARYDNVDLDNIVGFNTTLNELSGANEKPNLAEIDAQTADLILEDINMVLKRIDFSEGVHTLNIGNKYNVQDKTGLNKQYILYNKIKHFVSVLEDDDEWKDKGESTSLADLNALLNDSESPLYKYGKELYADRNFSVSIEEKAEIEKRAIAIQKALHKFLKEHIDGSAASVQKLKKILTYDNFKGLIRPNDGFLNQDSQDIDDSAFIWWLCATAALDPDQFYNNYRHIIGTEEEGEKPIAPLPVQELGVYALTASVVNGDMFNTFGEAIRTSLLETWESGTEETRDKIRHAYGANLLSEDKKDFFKNVDFLPNYNNILFIEGIAGSGKSTGTLKIWSKLMAKAAPEWSAKKALFAHTSKEKAEKSAKDTAFTNFEAHDHDSLLTWMSPDYKNKQDADGVSQYIMGKDLDLVNGLIRSKWELRKLDKSEIPSVIVVDEWTHYDQLEQELIQRFSQTYGVPVISMGDYDQLTAVAKVKHKETDADAFIELSPHRNMTARTVKYGVSMRTDNETKNLNMSNLLAWKLNPTNTAVNLHYYEDDTGIYGDKVYQVAKDDATYNNQLEDIKADVMKMINTLSEGESIGYVYGDSKSELYKWLTSTEGVKEHIKPYTEKDAHGREAQYYIIDGNKDTAQDAELFFNALNTGITRSEKGSIVIVPRGRVQKDIKDKYNASGILIKGQKDSKVQPNTYTEAGTREFSKRRKEVFDRIYENVEATPFEITPRTLRPETKHIPRTDESPEIVAPKPKDPTVSDPTVKPTNTPSTATPAQTTTTASTDSTTSNSEELPPPENIPKETYERVDLTEVPSTRTDEEKQALTSTWEGPLAKDQILYTTSGQARWVVVGEGTMPDGTPTYHLEHIENGSPKTATKQEVHEYYKFLSLPKEERLLNVGQQLSYKNNKVEVTKIYLENPNNPQWVYQIGDRTVSHQEVRSELNNKVLTPYVDSDISEEIEREPTVYETEDSKNWMALANGQFADKLPSITSKDSDINFDLLGFTFNTAYSADTYDKQGTLVLTDTDKERIDNGYGLYKLSNSKINTQAQIEEFLGKFRRHLEFSSNGDILAFLQKQGLSNPKIRWAFISKAKVDPRTGKYGRYNYPRAALQNMAKEDHDVPSKTISAIIYNSNNVPVLEVPMVTLQSPHSIFAAMKQAGVGKDITDLWTFGKKKFSQTYEEINNIRDHIAANHSNKPGYQKLDNILKLWLFTSNGVKMLPKDWNLHEYTRNKGNFYITERYADSNEKYNFSGDWVDLDKAAKRSDRFISSIYMNNEDSYYDLASDVMVPVFRKHTPYVLISDHPSITTDADAMNQYLKQQSDPDVEVIVKAIPVIPPETTVSDYIKGMDTFMRGDIKRYHFGNHYTPVRIWTAILASNKAEKIMGALDEDTKKFVIETITQLTKIKKENVQQAEETNLAYKVRIASKQNEILRDTFVGEGGNRAPVFQKLRKALIETCFFRQAVSDERGNIDILNEIQAVCDATKGSDIEITGVLGHVTYDSENSGALVNGVGYRVKTDGKYGFVGGNSFRIFGKIDTPTYDLNNLASEIERWAKDAVFGIDVYDSKSGQMKHYDNVWGFENNEAKGNYLSSEVQPKINLENVLEKGRKLLEKLGITDYNIDTSELTSCTSEAKALNLLTQKINMRYIQDPGAFFITDARGIYKYGNVVSESTSEFKNLKFERWSLSGNTYVLEFKNLQTNTIEKHEIMWDQASDSFLIKPTSVISTQATINVAEIEQTVREDLNNPIIQGDPVWVECMKRALVHYDKEANVINVSEIDKIIEEYGFDEMTKTLMRNTLKLDTLDPTQNKDVCVNPIKIKFK